MIKKLKSKNDKYSIGIIEVILLLILVLCLGILIGNKFGINSKERKIDKNIEKFVENYNYIVDNYYKKVDKKKLIDDAIAGMMSALDDPYSVYMDSNATKSIDISLKGAYEGLGLAVTEDENHYMRVVGVFKNSASDESGIEVNDVIKKVDDKEVKDMTLSDFSNYVLNNKETSFDLLIERDSKEKEITLSKSVVVIDSVISKVIEESDKKIGYLYISVFASNTYAQFKTKLKELEDQKIDALIIDVRDNTGGHLSTVESILKEFLTKKQVVYGLKKGNKITKVYGTAKSNKKYQILLLGNENSASASEMLIASLKENLKSKFIGKKTYGKGTVQEMVNINSSDKYKITTKKWLTPKGNWIDDTKGIEPDINVDAESKYYEDDTLEDEQLKKAIDIIKEQK